ncbi:hypothetical protein ACFLSE_08150 [Bacteroidota bacterium]
MLEKLKNTVDILKQQIRSNLDLIHENETKIKEILKEPVSEIRAERLNRRFNFNKKIFQENNDTLRLQKEIINYLETYQNNISDTFEITEKKVDSDHNSYHKKVKIELKKEDYFELTITGAMEFDAHHPYLNDEEFLNNLLTFYINQEDYEMCARLTNLDKNKNLSSK